MTISLGLVRPKHWRICVSNDCTPMDMRFTPYLNHTCNFSSIKSLTHASMVISQSLASGKHSFTAFNNRSALYGDKVLGVPPPKNTQ